MLNTIYPNNETKREAVISSSISGLLLYLLLIIYQPFGTHQFEHHYKYLLLFPYSAIGTLSFLGIGILVSYKKGNWTIGAELLKLVLVLIIISIISYFYNAVFISGVNLTFENLLYMFIYTSALGFPICIIYLLGRYIYLTKKDKARNTINTKLILKTIEEKEEAILHIIPDYGKTNLIISPRDIIYAEAADNYSIIHFYKNNMLQKEIIRISFSKLVNQIESNCIKRIHRSYLVNLKMVTQYKGNASGYKIALKNTERELIISRNYIDAILPILKEIVVRP